MSVQGLWRERQNTCQTAREYQVRIVMISENLRSHFSWQMVSCLYLRKKGDSFKLPVWWPKYINLSHFMTSDHTPFLSLWNYITKIHAATMHIRIHVTWVDHYWYDNRMLVQLHVKLTRLPPCLSNRLKPVIDLNTVRQGGLHGENFLM